ncbi:glycosyl transferase family 2 [Halobacteriales archaeon QS_8_69_26]|nr:MAG: glycosyl transferase family 2 [Halobacteriales archaeon QS_8_69_26]
MDLSVVVPTLNGREELGACLDSLSEHAPGAEVVVVNGPSADGTTGMVRERDDVDVLLEIADRNRNAARNAGIAAASGDVVALLGYDLCVEEGWSEAIASSLDDGADVVTGPVHQSMAVGTATEREETRTVAGQEVTYFDGDNVAFTGEAIRAIDGFDEYLETGAARDGSHRLATMDREVAWNGRMCARGEFETDGGHTERDRGREYRSFAYRLTKTYGVRPSVARRIAGRVVADAVGGVKSVAVGDLDPSACPGRIREGGGGLFAGVKDGLTTRVRDRRPVRNPHGLSARFDRAVETYDWR